jgi:peptidoglycan/xylan/chitin deacetylase (PgdA/CDA1 family)
LHASLESAIQAVSARTAEIELLRQRLQEFEVEAEGLRTENQRLEENNAFLRRAAVVSSVSHAQGGVAITIDDGASPEVLRILRAKGVTATFFPMGRAVEKNPSFWQEVVEAGHELGNHTSSHHWLSNLDEQKIIEELDGWQRAVDVALGYHYPTRWFRPPGMAGFTDGRGAEAFRKVIASKGLITALWSVETFWALYSPVGPRLAGERLTASDVAAYVVSRARPGSIILLHGGLDIAALAAIIDGLRAKGLEPVTLTQLVLSSPD